MELLVVLETALGCECQRVLDDRLSHSLDVFLAVAARCQSGGETFQQFPGLQELTQLHILDVTEQRDVRLQELRYVVDGRQRHE